MFEIGLHIGTPKRRVGVALENYQRTPRTQHRIMALPKEASLEVVKFYGISIGLTFIGIQIFRNQVDRVAEGFQFGPEPNVFDMISDSDNPDESPRDQGGFSK